MSHYLTAQFHVGCTLLYLLSSKTKTQTRLTGCIKSGFAGNTLQTSDMCVLAYKIKHSILYGHCMVVQVIHRICWIHFIWEERIQVLKRRQIKSGIICRKSNQHKDAVVKTEQEPSETLGWEQQLIIKHFTELSCILRKHDQGVLKPWLSDGGYERCGLVSEVEETMCRCQQESWCRGKSEETQASDLPLLSQDLQLPCVTVGVMTLHYSLMLKNRQYIPN